MTATIVTFTVPGQPQGQARHRARIARGRNGQQWVQTYDPASSRNYKALIQDHAQQAMQAARMEPFEGPVELRVEAVFLCPKTYHRKTKPAPRIWHTGKPDHDNIAKAISDAMNGVVYLDDAQVARSEVSTIRGAQGEPPRLTVTVIPLNGVTP